VQNSLLDCFSEVAGVGVSMIDASGESYYASAAFTRKTRYTQRLFSVLSCMEAENAALLHACQQAYHSGGRFVINAPSGLFYAVSSAVDDSGQLITGFIAGPFIMTEYSTYLSGKVFAGLLPEVLKEINGGISAIPVKTPAQARAICELLYGLLNGFTDHPVHHMAEALSSGYWMEDEDAFVSAVSEGRVQASAAILNAMLGRLLFQYTGSLQALRSRVLELTILLSRAAANVNADAEAVLGTETDYLLEIYALSSVEEVVEWLHAVTRRFERHVMKPPSLRYTDTIRKAIDYIKNHFPEKIKLQDIADSVYLSPTYFAKVFKEETGQTPGNFLNAVRIDAGKRLLSNTSASILEISERVGFENQGYFTRVFKKTEGLPPGLYRKGAFS